MVGETWETWKETVQKTIDADADSVTIYQMELPYNTVYSRQKLDGVFGGAEVLDAIAPHVLASASLTGTYSLNPDVPS